MSVSAKTSRSGRLYVVSTPIGNLRDITLRALDVLAEVDLVVAEDTRRTRKLLAAHGLKAPLLSLHARSSPQRLQSMLDRVADGERIAYVTDAGSPSVSDPGTRLVDAAHQAGLEVQVVPGPSALTAAVAVAGIQAKALTFLGFLPRQRGPRLAALRLAGQTGAGLALFESPGRIHQLLGELQEVFGDRRVALCRELTKVFEEVSRGTSSALRERLPEKPLGEFTVLVEEGLALETTATTGTQDLKDAARALLDGGCSPSKAAKALSGSSTLSRKEAYELILSLGQEDE